MTIWIFIFNFLIYICVCVCVTTLIGFFTKNNIGYTMIINNFFFSMFMLFGYRMVVLLFTLLNFNCNYETNSSSNGFFDFVY